MQIGQADRFIQPKQQITSLHLVTIADMNFSNNATDPVLNLLDLGLNCDNTGTDHGPRNLCGARPKQRPTQNQRDHDEALDRIAARVSFGRS